MRIEDLSLVQTCGGCPEAYIVKYNGETIANMRLRHGLFTVRMEEGGETVYQEEPYGDGIFEIDEREFYLMAGKRAVCDRVNKQGSSIKSKTLFTLEQTNASCPEAYNVHYQGDYIGDISLKGGRIDLTVNGKNIGNIDARWSDDSFEVEERDFYLNLSCLWLRHYVQRGEANVFQIKE